MEKFTYEQMHKDEKVFWWYVARRKIIRQVLHFFVKKQVSILEVGSGTGGNYKLLKQFGSYTGIEKEPLALKLAKSDHPEGNFLSLEAPTELDQLPQKYGLVALLDVIEHVDNDLETLKKLIPVLSNEAQMIITTPAFPFLWSAHDEVHHHYRRYTKAQLLNVCELAGYQVKYHSYFNCLLFPVAVLVNFTKFIRRSKKPHKTQISKTLNQFLQAVFATESKWIPKHKFPFGVSHIVVLEKIKSG